MKPQNAVEVNASSERDSTPNEVRCCVTDWLGSTKGVAVKRSENTIYFENCFVPRKLFAGRFAHFECSLDDIVVVYAYRSRVCEMLKIVTVSGTAEISERASTGFAALRAALACYSQPNRPGYALDNPALGVFEGLVYFGGSLVGLVVALCFLPPVAAVEVVALALLCGGVCGVLASKMLIHCAYRWWRVELVKPLGCGVLGAALALFVGVKLGPHVAWDWRVTFAPIPLTFLGGVVLGIILNRRQA